MKLINSNNCELAAFGIINCITCYLLYKNIAEMRNKENCSNVASNCKVCIPPPKKMMDGYTR